MALVGSTGRAAPRKKAKGIPIKKAVKAIKGGSIPKPVMKAAKGKSSGITYLAKSSGTTKKEVKGVLQQVRRGSLSKGGAIKALKGGKTAGVPASKKNVRKTARAIRRAR